MHQVGHLQNTVRAQRRKRPVLPFNDGGEKGFAGDSLDRVGGRMWSEKAGQAPG